MKKKILLSIFLLLSPLMTSAQTNLSGATITLIPVSYDYDGTECKPKVYGIRMGTERYNSLVEGVDYDLSYSDNINAGEATAILTFKGDYTGVATKTFTISPLDLTKESSVILTLSETKVLYDGTEQTPSVSDIYYNGNLLVCGTDYDLSYKNNINPGTATVTAAFKGNYTGKKTATFIITTNSADFINFKFDTSSRQAQVIGNKIYTGKLAIPEVVIHEGVSYSVTTIGDYAFSGCSDLTEVSIPNSVTSIGERAFQGCSGLASLTFGNGVTSIGNFVFDKCTSLTSVTIPNNVKSIGAGAFQYCSGLTSVTIGNSVTSIGNYAFYDCSGLTSVTIPNSVTSIGSCAFSCCFHLTSVISEITVPFTFGTSAFSDISKSCVLTVPIGTENAYIAKGWTINVFKGGVRALITEINGIYYNFDNSTQQATVIYGDTKYTGSVTIPITVTNNGVTYTVTSIGESAFQECSGLTLVTIPNSVTSIGKSAFYGCSGLTSVTIPNSINYIGVSAFSGCKGELIVNCDIPSSHYNTNSYSKPYEGGAFYNSKFSIIKIGEGVKTIGSYAFYGSSSTTKIIIPNSVTYISKGAFGGCTGELNVNCDIKSSPSVDSGAFYGSSFTSVKFGDKAKYIGGFAFYGCYRLTSVTISNSVTEIDGSAFYGCSGLTSVIIGKSVTSIGGGAFSGCSNLTSITIPQSVTSIGSGAFSGCSNLTSFMVESGNTKYDSRDNCNAIIETATNTLILGCKNTVIPNSVTEIGASAFLNCLGMTSVTIPNSVISIGSAAFAGCTGLSSITIPNSVTSIEMSAFASCKGITYVTIGKNMKSIGGYSFDNCSKLTDVYCYALKVPSLDSKAYEGLNMGNITLHVPHDALLLYLGSASWRTFGNIVALQDSDPMPRQEDEPGVEKCATPIINIVDGRLNFSCETEGVRYVYNFSTPSESDESGTNISTPDKIQVSVYATKDGFENSDVATKEIEVGGTSSGIRGDVNEDGTVNGTDIQEVINIIVNAE